jgi:adenosyl cobinamide kinase/adenosyl cobinamide phosphate guanylyltransferase
VALLSPAEAFDAFLASMDGLQECEASPDGTPTKLAVFHVSYVTVTEKREAPNPQHERWKGLTDAQRGGAKEPPATVAVLEHTRKLVVEEVNKVHRGVASLYLPKKDKDRLHTCLHSFVEKKALLQRLGLPNKLCVLLHGTPGCGKTSTATAVATYLRRPMYYVALKTLQTDAELREAFRTATAEDRKGGVIVLEDVDAMTDLVRDRGAPPLVAPVAALVPLVLQQQPQAPQQQQVPQQQQQQQQQAGAANGRLTLSCLLNLLQGTLTLDNMVVVATTNHLSHLDPALVREGRFDVRIELRPCDRQQVADMYRAFTGRTLSDALLARVPEHVHTPAAVMGHLLQYAIAGVKDGEDEEAIRPLTLSTPSPAAPAAPATPSDPEDDLQ